MVVLNVFGEIISTRSNTITPTRVYIILTWLIKVPAHIPILLDDLGNFENLVKIWTRRPPNYYQHASTNARKYGIVLRKYYVCQCGTHWVFETFRNMYVSCVVKM